MGENDVEIDNEASFRVALTTGMNLMTGAGFSTLARDAKGVPLPVGSALVQELRDTFAVDEGKFLNLSQLYTVLSATRREDVDDFLRQRFRVGQFDPRYRSLLKCQVQAIFTTNIDDLPFRIYESSLDHYLNDLVARGPVMRDRAAIDVLCLHGSVLDESRRFRFSTLEVASSFGADPGFWHDFRQQLRARPTLFWGYSLQDAASLEALQRGDTGSGTVGSNWIVLRPDSDSRALAEYFRALQFQLIFAETEGLLEYLGNFSAPAQAVSVGAGDDRLAAYRVPTLGTVPQRPLQDFFAGAGPAWSDIFRDEVPRLHQFRKALDSINAGKDVVLAGIPASGKTTLLMQLAAEGAGQGISLIPQDLSREGAERIIRLLKGAEATVYLDNFSNDIGAYEVLTKATNVQTVAADRDYHVSTVMHRLDQDSLTFISMTDLNDFDLGAIRTRIPTAIRTVRMEHPKTTSSVPSVLEFNLANTTSQGLARRLEDALSEFQRDQPRLGEMLLAVAYVHSCLTPMSLDMALSYWRDEIGEWREVYDMVDQVGQILTEYEGDLREDTQGYFAARSSVVAEAAIHGSRSTTLRTMLRKFHRNVSIMRICRYDIFRRRSYNWRLFTRAFPDTDEAMEFYDYLFERDPGPYLLQHKALFLNARGRYGESFSEIDRAVGLTNGRNWTIQASHAEILFQANISIAPTDDEARKQVERGMRLLTNCYASDRRRSLHALRFGARALQYHSLFGDEQARDYLRRAEGWLDLALRREPWLSRVSPLLRQIRRALAD